MIDAKSARSLSTPNLKAEQASLVSTLRASLGPAVITAANYGRVSVSVPVPPGMDPHTLQGVAHSLKKAGYRVKVCIEEGTLAPGLYKEPKTILTLFW